MVEEAKDNPGLAPEAEATPVVAPVEVVEEIAVAPEPAPVMEEVPVEAGSAIVPSPEKRKAGRPRKVAAQVVLAGADSPVDVQASPAIVKPAPKSVRKAVPVAKALVRKAPVKVVAKSAPESAPVPAKVKPVAIRRPVPAAPRKSPAVAPLPRTASASRKEHFIMTTTTEITEKFQTAFKDAGEKAKAAFEKSQASFGDVTEFAKGNVEAIVESSKILASGLQEMSKGYVTEGQSAVESLKEEIKGLTSVKSPTEFFEKQSALFRKQFDAAVAVSSKNSEAMLKLANEAFQPISNRVSIAVDKLKQAA